MRIRKTIGALATVLTFLVWSSNDCLALPGPPGPPPGGPPRLGPTGGFGPPRGLSVPGGIGGLPRPDGNLNGLSRPSAGINGPLQAKGASSRSEHPTGIGPNGLNGLGRGNGGTSRPEALGSGGGGRERPAGVGGLGSLARSSATAGKAPTYAMNHQALSEHANHVRDHYRGHECFRGDWWRRHSEAWRAHRWATAAAAYYYGSGGWSSYYGYCGYGDDTQPVYYDYGSDVVYQSTNVYINGEAVATQEQYAQQAASIAETGSHASVSQEDEWLALGVFAMVQGEQASGNDIFHLAVNKSGVLRGNYYNALSDTTLPVCGSVDKATQRAAWTIGDRKEPIFEAGFANLTSSETTMLVHFDMERAQQWTLVRIEPSAEPK